mmetsp:Transcript_15503/g.38257  ORF Transcript_15503/g.38257 Transcript_15503/m.38257 type:complete len:213 (+) Transcript_15503:136-774(+)
MPAALGPRITFANTPDWRSHTKSLWASGTSGWTIAGTPMTQFPSAERPQRESVSSLFPSSSFSSPLPCPPAASSAALFSFPSSSSPSRKITSCPSPSPSPRTGSPACASAVNLCAGSFCRHSASAAASPASLSPPPSSAVFASSPRTWKTCTDFGQVTRSFPPDELYSMPLTNAFAARRTLHSCRRSPAGEVVVVMVVVVAEEEEEQAAPSS